jgi:hypothetical protein
MGQSWNNFVRGNPKSSNTNFSQFHFVLKILAWTALRHKLGLHCKNVLTKSPRYSLPLFYGICCRAAGYRDIIWSRIKDYSLLSHIYKQHASEEHWYFTVKTTARGPRRQ